VAKPSLPNRPAVSRAEASVQQILHIGPLVRGDVKGGEIEVLLGGRRDAALMRAIKRLAMAR